MRKVALWVGLMMLLLLGPAQAVMADGPVVQQDGGEIYYDQDVRLEPGEVFEGSLGLVNGDLTIPAGSSVRGDVFVTNGDAEIMGRVEGNLAVVSGDLTMGNTEVRGDVMGVGGDTEIAGRVQGNVSVMFGNVVLQSTADIQGDLTVVSGSLERQEGAQVRGEVIPNIRLPRLPFGERLVLPVVPETPPMPATPLPPQAPRTTPAIPVPMVPGWPRQMTLGQDVGRFLGHLVVAGSMTLLAVVAGLLMAVALPRPVRRVAECISLMPVQSLGLGLLTFLLAAGLEALAVVIMIIIILVAAMLISTVILIPIGLLLILLSILVLLPVPLALMGGIILGWVGLAEVVGRRVLRALRAREIRTLGAVMLGMLLTGAVVSMLWLVQPLCCGSLLAVLLSSLGLGAVFHTRFGRHDCQRLSTQASPLPADAMDDEAGRPDHA